MKIGFAKLKHLDEKQPSIISNINIRKYGYEVYGKIMFISFIQIKKPLEALI